MALDLSKQVGPLPLGAWVAVVGAGLGVALWNRNNNATPVTDSETDVPRDTSVDPGVGDGTVGGWVPTSPDSSGNVQQAPQDNDAWGRIAITWLIAQGYDPALSQAAIAHALQGVTMSVREYALWGIALAHFGAPPYAIDVVPPVSVPGPTTGTKTPPAPSPAPALGKWYHTKPGDTLHRVSRKMYGRPGRWDDILRVNRVGVARPKGILPHPNPGPGWVKTHDPDAHLQVGRNLFIPR